MEREEEALNQDEGLEHLFLDDIRSRMASIADCIFRLEEQIERGVPVDFNLISTLMREFHTVKACADFDGVSTLAHVAHNVEDLLELFLKEHVEPDRSQLDLLYTVIDFTLQIIGDIHIPEEDIRRDADELIRVVNVKLGELTELIEQQSGNSDTQDDYLSHHQDTLDQLDERFLKSPEARRARDDLDELRTVLLEMEKSGEFCALAQRAVVLLHQVIHLKAWKIPDGLQRLVNELKVTLAAASRRKTRPEGCDFGLLSDVLVVIRNCYADLFRGGVGGVAGFDALVELISDIRWQLRVNIPALPVVEMEDSKQYVPLRKLAATVQKLIAKASKELNKDVEFCAETDALEIRQSYARKLNVVLAHLIRNALDHGVESAEERLRQGKPARGKLHFTARIEQNELCVAIQDDGRGLQRERIIRKARERGIIGADAVDVDVVELVMNPGFSTADVPTMYSGRGMGMGIVSGNIMELGGRLEMESETGKGSTCRMLIPLDEKGYRRIDKG
ncbi:MAG: ATP-binding protein [Kiritimatiellae bacterium]|nr:ATP-binding protein [Kiritimatiellia bacterium]